MYWTSVIVVLNFC